jgi:ribosomal protein S18 acetylase RimI-like enzyme
MQDENVTPSFIIRRAAIKDVDCLTDLHCASFEPEEHIPVMLGKNYVRATYRWLVKSSQAYCLVADAHPKIIGLVSVCDHRYTGPMFLACLPEFMKSLIRSPGLIFQRKLWNRLLRRPAMSKVNKGIADVAGFAQLIVIAVDPRCRGAGIFPALVESAKSFSKERGSVAIRAGVYKFNQASKRAFSKNGWIEIPELETSDTVFYVSYLNPASSGRLRNNLLKT